MQIKHRTITIWQFMQGSLKVKKKKGREKKMPSLIENLNLSHHNYTCALVH